MLGVQINKKMLRMKCHYVLYMGGISPVVGFLPTILKQLGYSPLVVGSLYTYLSFLSFFIKPIFGVIVDKYRVKKVMFLTFILLSGFTAFSLNYIQKVPTDTVVDFSCEAITTLHVCSNNNSQLSRCDENLIKILEKNTKTPVTCELFCQQNGLFQDEMCESWNISDYCKTSIQTTKIIENNELSNISVSLVIKKTNQTEKYFIFQVISAQIKGAQVSLPACQKPVSTQCKIDCSNEVLMELTAVPKFINSVLDLHQFWIFFTIINLFWISQAIIWVLQDPICFELLDDKHENYGKQRCWGSISWGMFSIFGGILVDYFSDSDIHKNYVPIYYLCLALIICNFVIAYKIEVTETEGFKNTVSDVFKLFKHFHVIVYFIWIIALGMCTSMLWNYLFWYMEDITMKYHREKQSWIKTLQGLTIGIQCIGGEMPLLFFSGWIIKRLGHWYSMCLGLFVFAIRFFLYSIITNPLWILPVEFTNGITFGLGHAAMYSYAKNISPPSAVTTVMGFAGSLFEGIGVSLGGFLSGYLYENFGGATTFRLFSYGSSSLCVLHLIIIKLSESNTLLDLQHLT